MVDRKSRFLVASSLKDLTTSTTNKAMIKLITQLGNKFGKVKTITSDNGSEFLGYEELMGRFSLGYFHCDPYSSRQRGNVENINRMLRRFFPKKTNIPKEIIDLRLKEAVRMINCIPKKILDYSTSYEVHSKKFTPFFLNC